MARDRDKTDIGNPSRLISRSVLDGVTKTGEPVLTTGAQTALSGSLSITALEVRSLIRVPLRLKDRIPGALYVDSKATQAKFNEESQNLLYAFARPSPSRTPGSSTKSPNLARPRSASASCSRSTCPLTSCTRREDEGRRAP